MVTWKECGLEKGLFAKVPLWEYKTIFTDYKRYIATWVIVYIKSV